MLSDRRQRCGTHTWKAVVEIGEVDRSHAVEEATRKETQDTYGASPEIWTPVGNLGKVLGFNVGGMLPRNFFVGSKWPQNVSVRHTGDLLRRVGEGKDDERTASWVMS
jgi:hypothetical protein